MPVEGKSLRQSHTMQRIVLLSIAIFVQLSSAVQPNIFLILVDDWGKNSSVFINVHVYMEKELRISRAIRITDSASVK